MQLTWLETASLSLQHEGVRLVFDPFLGIPYHEPAVKTAYFRNAQAVIITHGHLDHICQLKSIFETSPAEIYCTETPAASLRREGADSRFITVIEPGWRKDFGSLCIKAYQGRHCVFDRQLVRDKIHSLKNPADVMKMMKLLKLHLQYPENMETLFYDIHADGFHLQVMGSMGLDENTEYPKHADVLVLPFQGRSDIDECGCRVIERLLPQAVLLDHYDDTFPPVSANVSTGNFTRLMKERYGISCRALIPFETISLEEKYGKEKS